MSDCCTDLPAAWRDRVDEMQSARTVNGRSENRDEDKDGCQGLHVVCFTAYGTTINA